MMCWNNRCAPLQVLPGRVATSLLLPHFCLPPRCQTRCRLSGIQACKLENALGLSCFLLARGQEGEQRKEAESGESRLMGYLQRCQPDGQSSLGNVFSCFPCAAQRFLWKKSNALGSWPRNRGWETASCFSDQGPELRQELKPLAYTHLGVGRRKPFEQNRRGLVVSLSEVKGVASYLVLIKIFLEAGQLCRVFLSFHCPAT